jgi:hypothetical protein
MTRYLKEKDQYQAFLAGASPAMHNRIPATEAEKQQAWEKLGGDKEHVPSKESHPYVIFNAPADN